MHLPRAMADETLWPLITIVTPSFNQGHFIEETIRSVLLQGYPNLEYMIIDGGSTDESLSIIRKYESWLTYWVSEKDRGQSDAINKGWRRAQGEIVAYLNSDDILSPGALVEVASYCARHPECAVIHGQTAVVDENGNELKRFGDSFDLVASLGGLNDTVAQPSTFVRRKALEDVGLLDVDLHRAMDYDLWLRLRLKYSFAFVPEVWSRFRLHPKSKSLSGVSGRSECLQIVNKIFSLPDIPEEILVLKKKAFSWANLFRAQMHSSRGQSIKAVWYALKALWLDKGVCLKSGKSLFIPILVGDLISNKLLLMKTILRG